MGGQPRTPVTIRAATFVDAPGIAKVHVDSWRTTYPGIFPAEMLARLSYDWRQQNWERALGDPAGSMIILVAETAIGEMIGFASAQSAATTGEPGGAELTTIYILEAWQRHGVGARLAHEIVRRLIAAGQRSLLVWVAAENHGGRRFYEALGGQLAGAKQVAHGDVMVDEVAYRWPDIRTLEQAAAAARLHPSS